MNFVSNRADSVRSISFQPGTNGNIFASACGDSVFRIIDMRNNLNGTLTFLFPFYYNNSNSSQMTDPIVAQSIKHPGKPTPNCPGYLTSAMFSPADPTRLVLAGHSGTHVFDIRNPKK